MVICSEIIDAVMWCHGGGHHNIDCTFAVLAASVVSEETKTKILNMYPGAMHELPAVCHA